MGHGLESQRDLTRGRVVSGGDLLQHATASRARPREASRAEGAIADDGHVPLLTPRDHGVLDRPLLEVVEDLITGDVAVTGDRPRLFEVGHVEVAHAQARIFPSR